MKNLRKSDLEESNRHGSIHRRATGVPESTLEPYWADPTDHDVFQDLVASYQNIVFLLARQQTPACESPDDYVQVANIGLVKRFVAFNK